MAEFALGLTKTAVEGTLSRVKSVIEEEAKLKVQVQHDLVFITGEFQIMQSFLNVTSSERTKNEAVRTWVRQLRDLAFDVEDCVEFVVHLDGKSAWWWRMLPSCMAPPLPLDEAVAEIKHLKARVEEVSQRNTRYNLIIGGGNDSGSSSIPPAATAEQTDTVAAAYQILKEVWEDTGKMKPQDSFTGLKTLITSHGDDLQVISLWNGSEGAAHAGAMYSIIDKAYCDKEICRDFTRRAWVKLMRPFNPDEFLKSLLTQFNATASRLLRANDSREKMKSEPMATEDHLMRQVSEHRYLVILEEVSTVVEWDVIRMYLPDNNNGSRIVVSTKKLGIALLCAGTPYQVSEIRRFSDNQYSLHFYIQGHKLKLQGKGYRSDTGELNLKLKHGRVITLWDTRDGKSTLIDEVYASTMNNSEASDQGDFERYNWVDVPQPFDLEAFTVRLLLNFHLGDFHAEEIVAIGTMEGLDMVEKCCKVLRESDCLVVINGLQSPDDWDMIKTTFLSESTKSCVLVVTNQECVASHCADNKLQMIHGEDLEVGAAFDRIKMGCSYYGIEGRINIRFFSNRKEEAREWIDKYYRPLWTHREENNYFRGDFQTHDVNFVCGNNDDITKSAVVRQLYYEHILRSLEESNHENAKVYCWVNMPHPFSLMEFAWRLLLDFYSDDPQAKDRVAAILIQGRDPIPQCRKLLHEEDCIVVIDGLRSTQDWDLIKDTFLSEPTKSCNIVITTNRNVAAHEGQSADITFMDPSLARVPPIKGDRCSFSRRRVEARDWSQSFTLSDRRYEVSALFEVLRPGVMIVCGVAGVGKSALVRTFYYAAMTGGCLDIYDIHDGSFKGIPRSSYRAYSWADVPHPFNLTELSWRLLVDFHSDDTQTKETIAFSMMEDQDPIQGCCKYLREENCLVVIDGIQSTDDWDLIHAAFLSEPINGSIIVITNESVVETHCADNKMSNGSLTVKVLEFDASLRLFKEITWRNKRMTTREEEVSKLIMAKCGGLPEVIVSISRYMSKAIDEDDPYTPSIDVLEHLDDNFVNMLEMDMEFRGLTGLFCWMRSYFDGCSDSVKPCIFYLSVFSAGKNIRRRRLLRRWIAEGYSRDTSSGSTAEERGEMLFSELVKLSIIQKPSQGKKVVHQINNVSRMCQVNGFFREYIVSRPMEDNLVFALEGSCSPNSQRVGQHLAIRSCWDRDENVFQSMDLSRLRSLTVFGEWRSFIISPSNRNNMRMLRVLDLEDTSGVSDGDLEKIGKLFPRLKFLSLRGCREIKRLPDSLGFLRQLQTLDIRDTSIVMLPPAVIKLQKLQYIRAGNTLPLDEHNDWITCLRTVEEVGDDMVVATLPDGEEDQTSAPLEEEENEEEEEDDDDMVVATLPDEEENQKSIPLEGEEEEEEEEEEKEEEEDMVLATLPNEEEDQTSTPLEEEEEDNDDMVVATLPDEEEDQTSTPLEGEEGEEEVVVATRPDEEVQISTPLEEEEEEDDDDLVVATLPDEEEDDTSKPLGEEEEEEDGHMVVATRPDEEEDQTSTPFTWSMGRTLVSRLSQFHRCQHIASTQNGGVKVQVAAEIGKMTALHTLGVVHVNSGARGKAFLKELKKLTQLRKLGLSGINSGNWNEFCCAISGHSHLESLSVRLELKEDKQDHLYSLDDIAEPPKTLKSLKLYGPVHKLSHWIKQLDSLEKLDLQIATQEDLDVLMELPRPYILRRLLVKPVQDCKLSFSTYDLRSRYTSFKVLKIDCRSRLKVSLEMRNMPTVELLIIHCSSGSYLEISKLDNLWDLKEVWLKGSYSDALKQEFATNPYRPIVKLE